MWVWQEVAGLYQQQAPQIPAVPPAPELPVVEEEPAAEVAEPAGEFEVDYGADDDQGDREGSSSSDGSASASDLSADPQPHDLPGNLPDDVAMQEMLWFVQGRKVHIVCDTVESARYIPWCRESPFPQEFTRGGRGFGSLDADKVCRRCLSRMPRGLYAAVADFAGWIA